MKTRGSCPWLVFGLALLSGCAAGGFGHQAHVDQKGITCTDAQQVAIAAVQKMGYVIKEVKKPSPSVPGTVSGVRQMTETNVHRILVKVRCTTDGADVEANVEGGPIDNLSFSSDFEKAYEKAVEVRRPVRDIAEAGVDVLVAPERANNPALGVDLTGTGVLPVSVRITNRTQRRYRFKAVDVVLQQADGERVNVFTKADVASRVPAATATALSGRWIKDGELNPGDSVSGYLFFPFGGYAKARVTLLDIDADEEEGFSIEL